MSERAAFALLTVLHLVPVWIAEYPASCDGPAHLETAHALRERLLGVPSLHREYLAVRRDPTASWFPALTLAALLTAVPPVIALKLFMSGYVVLFPLAVRYAVRGLAAGPPAAAYAAFPLVYNRLFLYGFFAFLYGLTAFLFLVGWWLRLPRQAPYAWRLTAVALGLQFAHVFALLAALFTVTSLGLADAATAAGHRGRVFAERVLAPAHSFVPALVLAAAFMVPRLEMHTARADGPRPLPAAFMTHLPLTSYANDEGETAVAAAFLLLLLVAAGRQTARALRRPAPADVLALLAAAWWVVFIAAPTSIAHGAFLKERGALCALVTLVLWMATRAAVPATAGAGAFAVIALASLSLHAARFQEVSRQVRRYTACAERIAPGATLLPVEMGPSNGGVPFLEHAASYVALRRAGINLGNYQPATDHFPLALRPRRLDTDADPGALTRVAPSLRGPARRFLGAALAGRADAPDYLLVSGEASALLAALAPHYPVGAPCLSDRLVVLRRKRG